MHNKKTKIVDDGPGTIFINSQEGISPFVQWVSARFFITGDTNHTRSKKSILAIKRVYNTMCMYAKIPILKILFICCSVKYAKIWQYYCETTPRNQFCKERKTSVHVNWSILILQWLTTGFQIKIKRTNKWYKILWRTGWVNAFINRVRKAHSQNLLKELYLDIIIMIAK